MAGAGHHLGGGRSASAGRLPRTGRRDAPAPARAFSRSGEKSPHGRFGAVWGGYGRGSKLSRRGKPHVLVHVSTYQGSILEFRFFEPPYVKVPLVSIPYEEFVNLIVGLVAIW